MESCVILEIPYKGNKHLSIQQLLSRFALALQLYLDTNHVKLSNCFSLLFFIVEMITTVNEETVEHEPEMPSFFDDDDDDDDDDNDQESEPAKG